MKKWLFALILVFPQNSARDFSGSSTRIDRVTGTRVLVTRARHCEQVDGRATICSTGRVRYFASHWDHGHVPFFPPRNVECFEGSQPPFRFHAWRKIRACKEAFEVVLVHEGFADWDANRANRVFFLPRARILILGDLPASDLSPRLRSLRARKPDWILLPRAGAIGKKEAEALRALAPRLGFISSASRARPFDARGKIYLSATDWGNLIFAE